MPPLTVRAAATRLGVNYSTLKQWIYKGTVRTTRTGGGHHRIPEAEVERLLGTEGQLPPVTRTSSRGPTLVAISGRNQLEGVVEEMLVEGLLAQVRLRIGDQRLTAIITRDAITELKLKRGQPALAIIKSTEAMVARSGEASS